MKLAKSILKLFEEVTNDDIKTRKEMIKVSRASQDSARSKERNRNASDDKRNKARDSVRFWRERQDLQRQKLRDMQKTQREQRKKK